jgi:hypothetical protein
MLEYGRKEKAISDMAVKYTTYAICLSLNANPRALWSIVLDKLTVAEPGKKF